MFVPSGLPYWISPKAQLREVVWLGISTGLFGTSQSLWSSTYMIQASWSCLRLFRQTMAWALALARLNAGRSSAAKMAIIAITTSSSTKLKPLIDSRKLVECSSIVPPAVEGSRFQFVLRGSLPNVMKILAAVSEDGTASERACNRLEGHAIYPTVNLNMTVAEGEHAACPV